MVASAQNAHTRTDADDRLIAPSTGPCRFRPSPPHAAPQHHLFMATLRPSRELELLDVATLLDEPREGFGA